MTGLREHFTETAERAKHYDMTGRVIRTARRRQRLRLAAAGGAAVLVGWGTATVVLAGGDGRPDAGVEVVDSTGNAGTARLPWLPATFTAPASPPALPADRGVGEGALVWGRGGTAFLLTADGVSYAVPGAVLGLSPDGRWLAYAADGGTVFRSLTDTRTRRTEITDVKGWSVRGSTAVVTGPSLSTAPAKATVFDPESGSSMAVTVPDPNWWDPKGLSADGELLLVPRLDPRVMPGAAATGPVVDPSATAFVVNPTATVGPVPAASLTPPPSALGFAVGFVAPADGTARAIGVQDGGGHVEDGEVWLPDPSMALVPLPGEGLVFQILRRLDVDNAQSGGAEVHANADLIEISVESGTPVRRYRLPVRTTLDGPYATLLGSVEEGLLLSAGQATQPPDELELLDPATGTRHTVARIPQGATFSMTRGGTGF